MANQTSGINNINHWNALRIVSISAAAGYGLFDKVELIDQKSKIDQ
jgi:hypothetical protein